MYVNNEVPIADRKPIASTVIVQKKDTATTTHLARAAKSQRARVSPARTPQRAFAWRRRTEQRACRCCTAARVPYTCRSCLVPPSGAWRTRVRWRIWDRGLLWRIPFRRPVVLVIRRQCRFRLLRRRRLEQERRVGWVKAGWRGQPSARLLWYHSSSSEPGFWSCEIRSLRLKRRLRHRILRLWITSWHLIIRMKTCGRTYQDGR